jgi:glycosyltransferase involved in cell wall biosynthesis
MPSPADATTVPLAAPLHLTVAICTWNRAEMLRQTLERMRALVVLPDVEWEVLVVDNNSTDDTARVIADAAPGLPVRGVFEARPGKSHALNRGAAEARGEYILWTDDDVLVDERWLAEYATAFRRWPGAAFFGGPIAPWFAGTPPDWLPQIFPRVANAYAALDLGAEPVALRRGMVPYGANMAVRTAEQRRFLYDSALGPRPDSGVRGEEVAVVHAMLDAGLEGRWVPGAKVRHYIPAQRQTIAYLRDYYTGQGQVRCSGPVPAHHPKLFGRPRYLWRQAVEAEVSYRMGRLFGRPDLWIEHLIAASMAWGGLRGLPARAER